MPLQHSWHACEKVGCDIANFLRKLWIKHHVIFVGNVTDCGKFFGHQGNISCRVDQLPSINHVPFFKDDNNNETNGWGPKLFCEIYHNWHISKSLFSAVRLQFQVNEVLNVADLAAITLTQGTATTDAGLTSTQTAITTIVTKLNEILQKSTINNC